jgi:hypothetical protein
MNNAQTTLLATRRQIAEDMATGHGPEKHMWELGASNREEYRDIVESVLSHPHAQVLPLPRDRTAFYDESRNVLVILDPNSRDKGTAFQPDDGPSILKRLRRESR